MKLSLMKHGGLAAAATIRQSDTTMSASFAALLEWLERHHAGK
jgi:hypothetical protein